MLVTFAAALFVAATAPAQEKDQAKKKNRRPDRDAPKAIARDAERAAGVIVKAEAIRKGAGSRSDVVEKEKGEAPRQRLTINTAAVWRDWVRDQAGQDLNASPRTQAERGANSVATKGEPRSEDTEVVVDIGPNTKVDTRFRESSDETSKGGRTPAEAREASEDPATEKGKGGDAASREKMRSKGARVARFQAEDLKPGLFVEVDFSHRDGRNVATTVTVIRPLGGPDTPDTSPVDEGKGKGRAKEKDKAKGKR